MDQIGGMLRWDPPPVWLQDVVTGYEILLADKSGTTRKKLGEVGEVIHYWAGTVHHLGS